MQYAPKLFCHPMPFAKVQGPKKTPWNQDFWPAWSYISLGQNLFVQDSKLDSRYSRPLSHSNCAWQSNAGAEASSSRQGLSRSKGEGWWSSSGWCLFVLYVIFVFFVCWVCFKKRILMILLFSYFLFGFASLSSLLAGLVLLLQHWIVCIWQVPSYLLKGFG